MKLYNTPDKKLEEFKSLVEGKVGVYSCGPTVYWNQHIGHMYAFIIWDTMVRYLRYLGYDVTWVMNITDVGHLTGDNEGDPDVGEDKMEKGAKREGMTVWEVAEKYIKQFEESLKLLNIHPDVLPQATKHINEQINLIKEIEKNGFAYKTSTGLMFDTVKFNSYGDFARLDLKNQKAGARVEVDKEKKNPNDFLLWATNKPNHVMLWDSPWGKGYPGWHVECTAMSVKYLGERFDIHTGGKEHIPIHHTNEVAQAFAAFGHQTANFWLHNEWLSLKGEKMSKSLGNVYTVTDLVGKGYDPKHFRYLVLTSHYAKGLVFSFEALDAAKAAYEKLGGMVSAWKEKTRESLSEEKLVKVDSLREKFIEKIANNLNYPEGLAIVWETAKSNIPNEDKLDLVLSFDEVLGLNLRRFLQLKKLDPKVISLVNNRELARKANNFKRADELRKEITKLGYTVEDTSKGPLVKKLN
jgi:cysteinyl-tRNA synthetase